MADSPDREYSRAPELQDFLDLCRHLNAIGAKYVVIGGFAVIMHGSVRGTKDIDFLVDTSEENIRLIKKAMAMLPDNAIAAMEDHEVKTFGVVRVADEVIVDLMAAACGIDYAQAVKEGLEWKELDGVKIPLVSKALLIRTKETFRHSDQSDIEFLKIKIAEEARLKK